jgi:hypothetical protein
MKKSKQITYKKVECPICLRRIKYQIETNCMHSFCDICIMKHLIMKNTCPMCRTECDYEYVTNQIKVKRQPVLMKKLTPLVTPNVAVTREHIHPMTIYSSFIPQRVPASIMMISLFIVEIYIILHVVVFIAESVADMI